MALELTTTSLGGLLLACFQLNPHLFFIPGYLLYILMFVFSLLLLERVWRLWGVQWTPPHSVRRKPFGHLQHRQWLSSRNCIRVKSSKIYNIALYSKSTPWSTSLKMLCTHTCANIHAHTNTHTQTIRKEVSSWLDCKHFSNNSKRGINIQFRKNLLSASGRTFISILVSI